MAPGHAGSPGVISLTGVLRKKVEYENKGNESFSVYAEGDDIVISDCYDGNLPVFFPE